MVRNYRKKGQWNEEDMIAVILALKVAQMKLHRAAKLSQILTELL